PPGVRGSARVPAPDCGALARPSDFAARLIFPFARRSCAGGLAGQSLSLRAMKRSQDLIALTREHHTALVLARRPITASRDAFATA
ncbi:MAG: hypothetical protein ACTS6J_26415, partial [Burkholderiales bacterium]